jgi:heat shock protein HslJ
MSKWKLRHSLFLLISTLLVSNSALADETINSDSKKMVLIKTIVGEIQPKSVLASPNGLVSAHNMMYKHSVTFYDSNTFELKATVPDRTVEGTYWKLKTLGDAAISFDGPGREPSLTLHPADHRAAGSGGCNTFTGSYSLKPPMLTLDSMAATRRACVKGMDTESAYLEALARVRIFSVAGDALTLSDDSGKALATFVAVDF